MVACEVCTKTVYPLEAVVVQEKTFHKICFKCQDPECGISLTLKTAQPHAATGKVYCAKHYPKIAPTSVVSSVELDRAKNAPKLDTVNQQKRGDGMENPTVTNDSLSVQNAKNAPKLATVNQQKRGDSMENPTVTNESMSIQNAKSAHANSQKLHNDQVRNVDVPTSVIDYQLQNAINAPKLATVNEQKRGDSMESPTVTNDSMSIQNAKGAHAIAQKLHNDQVRGTGDAHTTSLDDVSISNALNAPKNDVLSPQIRTTEKSNFNVIV